MTSDRPNIGRVVYSDEADGNERTREILEAEDEKIESDKSTTVA